MINISNQWKQLMLTLPDNYFFELMKNYLGKIETPFNKHNLVDDLSKFLVKHEADKKILYSLDQKEILILTSVAFIEKPTAKSIFEFFLGDVPFIELCDILKTLEEKLVIYSDSGIIHISPLFSDTVNNEIINPGLLYKSEMITPGSGTYIWLTDSLILSFLSLLFHQKDLLKSSGAFKKRAYTQVSGIFPNLFSGPLGNKRIELIRRIIHNLKLFRIDDSILIPREQIWEKLQKLPRGEAWLYMVAAGTTESSGNLGDRITTVKRVIETVPSNRSFYPENLKKLIKALSSDCHLTNNAALSDFIEDLIVLNVLEVLEDGTITKNPLLDLSNINPDYGDRKTIIIQPNFDITFKPWINFKDGYFVSIFSDLKKMDIYTEFSLTKESVLRGLTVASIDTFINSVEKITANPIPDNIRLSLREWEKESVKARHYEASVVIVDKDKDFIIKETGVIDHLILLNPANGIYLIKPEDYKRAKVLLESVDIFPVDKNHSLPLDDATLPDYIQSKPLKIEWEEREIKDYGLSKNKLLDIIKNLPASKEEAEDLKKRVTRGIIFTKEQLQTGISKTDFSEAKGINYQAKLRLIEVSLKSTNDRLEINYVEDFQIKKELILPTKIEKQGELKVLHGIKLPQEQPYSIDISKISLVRRIQTTLF